MKAEEARNIASKFVDEQSQLIRVKFSEQISTLEQFLRQRIKTESECGEFSLIIQKDEITQVIPPLPSQDDLALILREVNYHILHPDGFRCYESNHGFYISW